MTDNTGRGESRMTRLRKRTGAVLASLAALFSSACAQQRLPTPVPPTLVEAEAAGLGGPALWKVADEDTTIYLFGTVHALPPETEWMRPSIADALASSDTLVTEVELTAETAAQMQSAVMSKGMLPPGESLRALLNAQQLGEYEAAVVAIGLKPETFDRFEPWYAAMMMTMLPLVKQGYATDTGVETVLGTAAGTTKTRAALETIDYQLSIFDNLPQDAQVRYLMEVIEGNADIKAMLDAMVAEWLKGDAEALAKLVNDGLTDADLADRLLYQRNRNWAEWIAQRLDTPGTVFMAVGAGHLAGKGSVQDALAGRGIAAVRVQ